MITSGGQPFRVVGTCALISALLALAIVARPARADVFGATQLTSAGRLPESAYESQAGEATDPALAADGAYVVFDGHFGGKTGIFRRDIATGEVDVVVEGAAELPSISAEGRYISFTTTERLDEENDTNVGPDVYVRDMQDPSSAPCGPEWEQLRESCPFTLASAEDGSSHGLTYEINPTEYESGVTLEELEKRFGSVAAGRSALSASGREVAFVTTAGAQLGEGRKLPRGQVLVRYLDSHRTVLVSTVRRNGQETSEPVPSELPEFQGAAFPGGEHLSPGFPLSTPYVGASLSAEGNVVAWLGNSVASQAPTLSEESLEASYTEPLWREVSETGLGPTRRITGGSDPESPACIASGQTRLPTAASLANPCQGPFGTFEGQSATKRGTWTNTQIYDFLPQLSANGQEVAMLSDAHYVAAGEELDGAENSDDLYTVNMAPGLTRTQAITQLTTLAAGGFNSGARTNPIVDLGISPDGTQVAFASARTVFPLGLPTLVSETTAALYEEVYEVDLADETMTRVTRGYAGQATEAPSGQDSAGSPSFAADDSLLSYDSSEDNLIYGDGNAADDSFLVAKLSLPANPTAQVLSSPPAQVLPTPAWKLSATATSARNGTVTLHVLVPGAGNLSARAVGHLKVTVKTRHGRRVETITATVATARKKASQAGLVTVVLQGQKRYAALIARAGGLKALISLSFSAPQESDLHYGVRVSFHRVSTKKAK